MNSSARASLKVSSSVGISSMSDLLRKNLAMSLFSSGVNKSLRDATDATYCSKDVHFVGSHCAGSDISGFMSRHPFDPYVLRVILSTSLLADSLATILAS